MLTYHRLTVLTKIEPFLSKHFLDCYKPFVHFQSFETVSLAFPRCSGHLRGVGFKSSLCRCGRALCPVARGVLLWGGGALSLMQVTLVVGPAGCFWSLPVPSSPTADVLVCVSFHTYIHSSGRRIAESRCLCNYNFDRYCKVALFIGGIILLFHQQCVSTYSPNPHAPSMLVNSLLLAV